MSVTITTMTDREVIENLAISLAEAICDEVKRLHKLIVHMRVHSGYRNNGYMQMTTEQKALYDAIWNHSVEELDREEKGISDGE